VFVHLYAGEDFVAQHDSIPALGLWPTHQWPLNSQVTDAHPLVLPPDRREALRVCMGVYHSTTLERLKIESAAGHAVANDVACRGLLPAAP
jgi:hypothetical protein